MADFNYANENVVYRNEGLAVNRPNWGSIWAGTFTFVGIFAIFESLGAAIFASAATPGTGHVGIDIGMSIWSVVLTIIAMFVAGRVTGQMASPADSAGLHAMVMFGLSFAAALVILVIGEFAMGTAGPIAGSSSAYLINFFTDFGWPLFVALLLGGCAALGGAMTASKEVTQRVLGHQQQPSHA